MQQPKAPDGWAHLGINLGNQHASNTIIKVCNPYRGPCSKAHFELEELIAHNKNVKLKIIFKSRNIEGDMEATITKHLMAINAEGDISHTKQALDDWYLAHPKDYNRFSVAHSARAGLIDQGPKLNDMSKWCIDADVTGTPTIFINGYRMPENYDIKELKQIL